LEFENFENLLKKTLATAVDRGHYSQPEATLCVAFAIGMLATALKEIGMEIQDKKITAFLDCISTK